MAQDPQQYSQKLGKGMIWIAWILVLGVLTLLFNNYLERQYNPNRETVSRITETGAREVVLERNRHGHYVASGEINGERVVFLLDTGATLVSVPAALASRLGLERGPGFPAVTANGTVTVYGTRLDSVRLGDIEVRDVRASINPGLQGDEVLLGMSFMQDLELLQRGGTLTLRQL
jgi:aspartyl protease family protein